MGHNKLRKGIIITGEIDAHCPEIKIICEDDKDKEKGFDDITNTTIPMVVKFDNHKTDDVEKKQGIQETLRTKASLYTNFVFKEVILYMFSGDKKYPSHLYGGGGGGGYGKQNVSDNDGGGGYVYEPGSRSSFVIQTLSITLIMLTTTALCGLAAFMIPPITAFVQKAAIVLLIVGGVIVCFTNLATYCLSCSQRSPVIYVMLVLVTIGFSLIISVIATRYKSHVLTISFLATAALVLLCLGLAFTKFDFTSWMLYVIGILFIFGVLSMLIMVLKMFTSMNLAPLQIGITIVLTIAQSVMLIIEFQMILGGKSVELSEDQSGFGSFMLYDSIMTLFLRILHSVNYFMDDM